MYLVPDRTTTMDVRHRGSYVAIGAALFNARVAAASLKNLGDCQLFPEGSPSHHVATLLVGDADRLRNRPAGQPACGRGWPTGRSGTAEPIDEQVIEDPHPGCRARRRPAAPGHRPRGGSRPWPSCWGSRTASASCCPRCTARWWGSCASPAGTPSRRGSTSAPWSSPRPSWRPSTCCAAPTSWRIWPIGGPGRRSAPVPEPPSVPARRWPWSRVPRTDPAWYVRGGAAVERLWLTAELHGLAVQPVSPVFLYAIDDKDFLRLGGERHVETIHRPVTAVPRVLGPRRRGAGRRCCSA